MKLVLPLGVFSLGPLRLIPFLGGTHGEAVSRLGLHGWRRQELFEILARALRTSGDGALENERLGPLPALFALKIENRHRASGFWLTSEHQLDMFLGLLQPALTFLRGCLLYTSPSPRD